MNPEDFWVELPDLWGTEHHGHDDFDQAPVYQEVAKQIIDLDASRVLDIGGNVGVLGWFLAQGDPDIKYYLLENNPRAVAAAVSNGYTALQGNLRALKQKPRYYDTVVVKDVLEYLESFTLLSEAFRIAGTYVVVASYIPWTLGENIPPVTLTDSGLYENTYHIEEVAKWANQQGWKVLRFGTASDRLAHQSTFCIFTRMTEDDLKARDYRENLPLLGQ